MNYFEECFGEYRTAENTYEIPDTQTAQWFLEIVGWENVTVYNRVNDKTIIVVAGAKPIVGQSCRKNVRNSVLRMGAIKF